MAKQNNRQPEIDPVGAQSVTPVEPIVPTATKAPPGLGGPTMPTPPAMPQPVVPEESKPFGMAEGGLLEEGGLLQEGGTVDEESGNEVPTGSLKEEVRDDIPAKLSEGEFVFPADVVRFIGLERLMKMRQAAKEGLKKMEAMGQMGNSEEATMEDDAEFETEIDDILEEIDREEEDKDEESV